MNTTESSVESPDGHVPAAASSDQIARRWSWPAQAAFLFTGVLLPIFGSVCLYFSPDPMPSRPLSGEPSAYTRLLLLGRPPIAFYPFSCCTV